MSLIRLVGIPTHRLVRNLSDFNIESILERLAVLFEVQEFGTLSDLPQLMTTLDEQRKRYVFGMVVDEHLYFLALETGKPLPNSFQLIVQPHWKSLT